MLTKLTRNYWTVLSLFVAILSLPLATQAMQPLATIPFVGCPADGQQGPVAAPKGHSKELHLTPEAAAQLAWYQTPEDGGDLGMLAPRGWHCFGTYGSSGQSLYVCPEPIDADKVLFQHNWHGFTGPVVQLSISIGDTSGRFEVARVVARVFPAHRAYARGVMAEHLDSPVDYHFGPFPTDKLVYRSHDLVEFVTPAQAEGLGTMSWLRPGNQPISGLASIDVSGDMSLTDLDVRLPSNLEFLAPSLINFEERNPLSSRN